MSLYRNSVWFVKGMREYTKSGFNAALKYFNPDDLNEVDLTNKRILITGANSGIGLECASELARRGAHLHILCRSEERGKDALQQIISKSGNQNVKLHILDMSKTREVYNFAKDFCESYSCLDTLINNAGCMVNTLTKTEDGLEVNFATNTIGTFVLTENLIPILLKAPQPRVIVVSSGGMLVQKLNSSDPELLHAQSSSFDSTMVYAQNKRQQVVLVEQWASKHPNIFFASMHPGWADTPAVATSMPSFHSKLQNQLRTALQGADTIIWLACKKNLDHPNGSFFQDRRVVTKHLPLASTHSTEEEKDKFFDNISTIVERIIQSKN